MDTWLSDIGKDEIIKTIIDPSAASFIAVLRNDKPRYKVQPADNAVVDGIRETATAMRLGLIRFSPKLKNWRKEMDGYVWDDDPAEDKPVKENDHAADAMRYFVKTMNLVKKYNRAERKPLWN